MNGFFSNVVAHCVLLLFVMGSVAADGRDAAAQSDVGPPLGVLYVSLSPDSYEPILQHPQPFTPYDLYVVVDIDFAQIGAPSQNLSNGLLAYEFGISSLGTAVLLSADYVGEINIGSGSRDWIVGVGIPVIPVSSTPRPLVKYSFGYFSTIVDFTPIEVEVVPASIQTVPGQPIWQESLPLNGCTNRLTGEPVSCFFPFAELRGLLIYWTPVESTNWGTLKQTF